MSQPLNKADLTVITAPESKTGKRIVKLFENAGLPFRGASRRSKQPFDWTNPETWVDTLQSARAIYIVLPPELAFADLPEILQRFLTYCSARRVEKVVFRALHETGHENKTYEVTGPELLSFEDVASLFSKQLGRPVKASYLPLEDYVAMLESYQVPSQEIQLVKFLYSELLDGRNERVGFGVEEALGRRSRILSQFIERTRPTGVWR